jgi:predicted regulator of Ras-like GTPase activity (Roadblock/LC7/MglB family)
MPYQVLLDGLVRSIDGVRGALLLDGEGEVVVQAGERGERPRLVGAYQGIALAQVRRTHARLSSGTIEYVLGRYAWGHVIVRPLKDGYYLVLSLGPGASVSRGLYRSADLQRRINAWL